MYSITALNYYEWNCKYNFIKKDIKPLILFDFSKNNFEFLEFINKPWSFSKEQYEEYRSLLVFLTLNDIKKIKINNLSYIKFSHYSNAEKHYHYYYRGTWFDDWNIDLILKDDDLIYYFDPFEWITFKEYFKNVLEK